MLQFLLRAKKETKELSPEKIVSTTEFDGGSQEVLWNRRIQVMVDFFGRQSTYWLGKHEHVGR